MYAPAETELFKGSISMLVGAILSRGKISKTPAGQATGYISYIAHVKSRQESIKFTLALKLFRAVKVRAEPGSASFRSLLAEVRPLLETT